MRKTIKEPVPVSGDSLIKAEFSLSAFGVESDDFPSIEGRVDFINKDSKFQKSYYNPVYPASSYTLSEAEM